MTLTTLTTLTTSSTVFKALAYCVRRHPVTDNERVIHRYAHPGFDSKYIQA